MVPRLLLHERSWEGGRREEWKVGKAERRREGVELCVVMVGGENAKGSVRAFGPFFDEKMRWPKIKDPFQYIPRVSQPTVYIL